MKLTVVVGNPKAGSRTLMVAEAVAAKFRELAPDDLSIEVIDLARYVDELLDWSSPKINQLVESMLAADLSVVASPTYKATYTGLLKVFLDRIAGGALLGQIAVPVMVAGAPQHALAVETHLRPLLVELGATCLTPGLCVLESELDQLDSVIEAWWARVLPLLARLRPREALPS
jgi:FMN reductase